MKKRILLLCLSIVLIFSFAGCSNNKNENVVSESKDTNVSVEKTSTAEKIDNEVKVQSEVKEEKKEIVDSNVLNEYEDLYFKNCDFIHVIDTRETSDAEVVDGIQVKKVVYSVTELDNIFVNSEETDKLGALMVLRVATNKPSDIKRINNIIINDLSKDVYTVDVIENPCCNLYVFKIKMPILEDSIEIGFGVNDYVSYFKVSEMDLHSEGFTHVGESLFGEGSFVKILDNNFFVSRIEKEIAKDISTENEHIALKQSAIELIPLDGKIKLDNLDNTKWILSDLNGNDLNEYKDDQGGIFTYQVVTVSPEFRNAYNNDLVHSVYFSYKYINDNLTGDELEAQMDKIISDSVISFIDTDRDFYRNFVINY